MTKARFGVLVVCACSLLVSNALASPVGTLNVGTSGTVTISLTFTNWNADPAATGGGNMDVATGTNLQFAGCASGVLGSAGCLSATEGVTATNLSSATPFPINSFMTFAAHASLVYSANGIGPGSASTNCAAANANGLSCSVFAGSPVILTFN